MEEPIKKTRKTQVKVDWAAMEREYRKGVRSNTDIAKEFGVSDSQLSKRSIAYGWVKDYNPHLKALTESKLLVSKIENSRKSSEPTSAELELAAQVRADRIREHRGDIARLRRIANRLIDELEGVSESRGIVEQMTLALEQGDMDELSKACKRATSLQTRSKTLVDLVTCMKQIVALEREAYGIDQPEQKQETMGWDLFLRQAINAAEKESKE